MALTTQTEEKREPSKETLRAVIGNPESYDWRPREKSGHVTSFETQVNDSVVIVSRSEHLDPRAKMAGHPMAAAMPRARVTEYSATLVDASGGRITSILISKDDYDSVEHLAKTDIAEASIGIGGHLRKALGLRS